MKLSLAPMEGVVDWILRDMLTGLGGIDQCTTEFIRVTQYLHSEIVFRKFCPELRTGSRTRAGTPIFVQLLGGQPGPMALNAARAASLGAAGIDLNFGCPAKTVNRHDGGASLLKCPERIHQIVREVRAAVPVGVPVTVKIRLGFDDRSACLEVAPAAAEAGATALTVHCRSKTDGYMKPAHWDWIPRIREVTDVPLIVNGEIWNRADLEACRSVAGGESFMIGRGALADPYVFQKLKGTREENDWQQVSALLPGFFAACTEHINAHFATSRTKQWLKSLALRHPQARELFQEIKVLTKPPEFRSRLETRVS